MSKTLAGLAELAEELTATTAVTYRHGRPVLSAGDPAAIWQGSDYTTPICAEPKTKPRKPRKGTAPVAPKLCATPFRAVWRESGSVRFYGCPIHGADAKRTAPTDAPTVHSLRGARTGMRRGALVEHVAWCTECGATHTCLPGARNACGRAWQCPSHGADHVIGADLPRALDTGTAAEWADDSNPSSDRPLARYIDTPRGERVPFGQHAKRRGQSVRPEPTEPMTASGRYETRYAAPRADDGAVIVRQALPAVIAPDRFGNLTSRPMAADAAPVRVTSAAPKRRDDDAPDGDVRESLPTAARAALIRRDARVAPILAAQAAATAPARKAHATKASRAAATKRAAAADAKRAERAARAATVAELAALAATLRANVAAAAPVRTLV